MDSDNYGISFSSLTQCETSPSETKSHNKSIRLLLCKGFYNKHKFIQYPFVQINYNLELHSMRGIISFHEFASIIDLCGAVKSTRISFILTQPPWQLKQATIIFLITTNVVLKLGKVIIRRFKRSILAKPELRAKGNWHAIVPKYHMVYKVTIP